MIREIKADFKTGKLAKADFIDRMHQVHDYLFEYQSSLKDTDIAKIEIEDDRIIMTTRERGIKMVCDKDDKRIIPLEIFNFDAFEKEELQVMEKLIPSGSTVFDVGANVGWYSLNFAKKIANVHVFAFEPVPKTFEYLTTNLALNTIESVQTFNIGFSNEEAESDIFSYPEGMGNASLADVSGKSDVEKVRCKFVTMDLFTERNNIKPDFIKCDVEGAELLVFRGASLTLKRDKPIVFTEMLRKWSAKFNYHPNDMISFFKEIGYNCYVIEGNTLKPFGVVDDSTLQTNYIFIHQDKLASVAGSISVSE